MSADRERMIFAWLNEAATIPDSVWDTVANRRSEPMVKKITVDELKSKMRNRGLSPSVYKLIGAWAPRSARGIDLLTDIVNEQRMDAAAEAVAGRAEVKKDRGGPRIEDHTREQLNNAVEQAAEIFGHKEFYKMLHGIDAYFERRYRDRTGRERWWAQHNF